MASVNQETGNPPTAVEWQLQTLSAAIKQLTQQNKAFILQNQALEVQTKQPQEHQVLPHDQHRNGHNHLTKHSHRPYTYTYQRRPYVGMTKVTYGWTVATLSHLRIDA